MDGNDRDESANQLPTLGGLFDLKDWLTLGEAAKLLARSLRDEVSEADVLRLGMDGRLVLSVRIVNATEARRGLLVPGSQATYKEVPSLDGQGTVRLYRGPQLNNGDVIELEEGIAALRGVFDLPMIGGERYTVEAEYQRRAVEEATAPRRVVETDVALDGAFVTNGAAYFQLQDWLEGDGFKPDPGKGYSRPVRVSYPRGGLPEDAVVVVRPGPLRELLARMNAEAKPMPRDAQGETTEQRQARRYKMCIDADLPMPTDDYAHLPNGVGDLAKKERITRQAFAEDVKAHIRRLNGR